jgi:hypothetical protein
MSGGDDITRLKQSMARILPMQLKGEFGLRPGEMRWLASRETFIWIPEKLQVGTTYEIRVDLREQGRTVDGTVTVTEVHSSRKLGLRPGYLVVATYKIPDKTHQDYFRELLARIRPDASTAASSTAASSTAASSTAASSTVGPGPQKPAAQPAEEPDLGAYEPASVPSQPISSLRRDPEPDLDDPSVLSRTTSESHSRSRSRSGRVRRDRMALTPVGPPPKRRDSPAESKQNTARTVGRLPLGKPPRRKPAPADPVPVGATIERGPPASLFIQFQDADQARGAIQGDPPGVQVWLTPDDALIVGQRPSVAFNLPGGRFLQLAGLISSRNHERALLTFPDAVPEDLYMLTLARVR